MTSVAGSTTEGTSFPESKPRTTSAPACGHSTPMPVEELRLPTTALIVIGICELVSIPVSFLMAAWLQWLGLVLGSLLTAFGGIVTVLTGLSLRRMQNSVITTVGLILCVVPSYWWLVRLPFVLMALYQMRKPHVRAAFQEIPWQQSDAWQQSVNCAAAAKSAALWSGRSLGTVGKKAVAPIRWLARNRKLQWSLFFVVGSALWTLYGVGVVAFAIHADEAVLKARGLEVTHAASVKSGMIALLPFVLGVLVIARYCQRRFRKTADEAQRKRGSPGLVDALLTLLMVALLASVGLSALSHLDGFVFPQPLVKEAEHWAKLSASRGLDLIYFSYAIVAGVCLLLVWTGWFKLLTQCLVVIALVVLPIGSMALAGTATAAPFYWSMLLPIWLSVPVGIWTLVGSVTSAAQPTK